MRRQAVCARRSVRVGGWVSVYERVQLRGCPRHEHLSGSVWCIWTRSRSEGQKPASVDL